MAKALVVNKQRQPPSKTIVAVDVIVGISPIFIAILAAIIIPNFMAAQPWVKEANVKGGMFRTVSHWKTLLLVLVVYILKH